MKKILVLGRKSASTFMLIQCLKNNRYDVSWVEERRDDKIKLLINRIKRQGLFKVIGQLFFLIFKKNLNATSDKRKRDIINSFGLVSDFSPEYITSNINSPESIDYISERNTDLIILSGTRILSHDFLLKLNSPILNIHAGINPKYRGVHGGYWALVNNDLVNFGSTIHMVDEGVDTGEVLAYAKINITEKDNFITYPILQQKAALELLPNIIENIFSNNIPKLKVEMESNIWTHPTIFQYLYYRFKLGVK